VSDALAPAALELLVGGSGSVRFAVPLDRIDCVQSSGDLPERYRCVNVPRLFDLPTAPEDEDRYARVLGANEPCYLRLGPDVRVEALPSERLTPIPSILAITAARWAWAALGLEGGQATVLLDPLRLAVLGAPHGKSGSAGDLATRSEQASR
jgi:hypothetical protein